MSFAALPHAAITYCPAACFALEALWTFPVCLAGQVSFPLLLCFPRMVAFATCLDCQCDVPWWEIPARRTCPEQAGVGTSGNRCELSLCPLFFFAHGLFGLQRPTLGEWARGMSESGMIKLKKPVERLPSHGRSSD